MPGADAKEGARPERLPAAAPGTQARSNDTAAARTSPEQRRREAQQAAIGNARVAQRLQRRPPPPDEPARADEVDDRRDDSEPTPAAPPKPPAATAAAAAPNPADAKKAAATPAGPRVEKPKATAHPKHAAKPAAKKPPAGAPPPPVAAAKPPPPLPVPPPLLPAPPLPPTRRIDRAKQYDPVQARAEVEALLVELGDGASRRKDQQRARAAATKAQIAADAAKQLGAASAAVAGTERDIAAELKKARAFVTTQANAHKALARAHAMMTWAELVAATATTTSDIEKANRGYQEGARKAVRDTQTAARKFGAAEGRRGRLSVEGQAREAVARGQKRSRTYSHDERGELQSKAVVNVANTMANQLLEPAPEIERKATEQGVKLADTFSDAADAAVTSLAQQETALTQPLMATTVVQLAVMRGVGDATALGIDLLAGQVQAKLTEVEHEAHTQLMATRVGLALRFTAAVAVAHASIDQQLASIEGAIDDTVRRAGATARATQRPDPAALRGALRTVDGMLEDATGGFGKGLGEAAEHAATTYGDAAKVVKSDMARIGGSTSTHLAMATAGVLKGMAAIVQKELEGLHKSLETWKAGLADAKKATDEKWGEVVKGVRDKLDAGLAKGKPEITKAVDEAEAKNREPLSDLDSKMDDAAEEAAYKYDHPIRYKLKRALWAALKALAVLGAVLLAAVIGIFLILVGILAGAFWLVVAGIVILCAVVAFALYGIISGIVHRISSATSIGEGFIGFFVGILDITGVPNIIEGSIEMDLVNGRTLTLDEAGDRLGGGSVAFLTFVIPAAKGIKAMRGAPKVPIEVPVELPSEVAVPDVVRGGEPLPTGEPPPATGPTAPVEPIEPVEPGATEPRPEARGAEPKEPPPPEPKEPPPPEPKAEPKPPEPKEPPPPEPKPTEPKPAEPPPEPKPAEPKPAEPPPEPKPAEPKPAEPPPELKPAEPKPAEPPPEPKPVEPKPVKTKAKAKSKGSKAAKDAAPDEASDASKAEEAAAEKNTKAAANKEFAEKLEKAADEETAELGEEPETDVEQPEHERTPPEKTTHWSEVEKFLKQPAEKGVPKGYRLFKYKGRNFIRRLTADNREWPRLTIDEHGNIKLGKPGSTRISKSGQLAKNLVEARELETRPEGHQAHHVVPDEVVKTEPLFEEARSRETPYDVDRASNGDFLPDSAEAKTGPSANKPIHSGSHPIYSKMARELAKQELADLQKAYPGKTLKQIPDQAIADACTRVETAMRSILDHWVEDQGLQKLK